MTDAQLKTPPSEPVLPPDDLDAQRASWPTVIGILSIIYAVMGFLANGCGAAFSWLGGASLSMMGLDGADFQLPLWLKVSQTVIAGFGVVLAFVLLVAAIGLLRRTPSAVRVMRTWIVLAIVKTLLGVGLGFASIQPNVDLQLSIQDAVLDRVKADGGDPTGPAYATLNKDEETIRRETIVNLAVFGGLPLVYPVVVGFLITNRRRVAEIEAWGSSSPVA